jgi:hypothetical protein
MSTTTGQANLSGNSVDQSGCANVPIDEAIIKCELKLREGQATSKVDKTCKL